jgi:hypothetical protein
VLNRTLNFRREVNHKEIEESTGLYMIWMLELARRKSSAGKLYRRVKKDPSSAVRLDGRCQFPGEPNQSF